MPKCRLNLGWSTVTKICIKCGIDKPLSEFHINRPKTGGRHSYCKVCLRDYTKARDAANADAISARRKADRAANPEKYKARSKAYIEANRDAIATRTKAYYEANPEAKAVQRERNRLRINAIRAKDPDYGASQHLKQRFGLTLDDYNQMLEDQGGLCANPGCFNVPLVDRRFDVDHDHACCSGKKSCGKCVRGLLCHSCNLALGLLHEDVKRIQGLADYLESRQQ